MLSGRKSVENAGQVSNKPVKIMSNLSWDEKAGQMFSVPLMKRLRSYMKSKKWFSWGDNANGCSFWKNGEY